MRVKDTSTLLPWLAGNNTFAAAADAAADIPLKLTTII